MPVCHTCLKGFVDNKSLKLHLDIQSPGCKSQSAVARLNPVSSVFTTIPGLGGFANMSLQQSTPTKMQYTRHEQTIKVVEPVKKESSGAVDTAILVDQSGSMAGSASREVDVQVADFFRTCLRDTDTVQIVGFNSNVNEILKPTKKSDVNIADRMYKFDGKASGGTNIWDALEFCVDQRKAFIDQRKAAKSDWKPKPYVLLLLTDGDDSRSVMAPAALKAKLQHPGVPDFHVHLVGLGNTQFPGLVDLSKGCGHIQFSDVKGESNSVAIAEIFRKKFTSTITKARTLTVVTETVEKSNARGSTKDTRVTYIDSGAVAGGTRPAPSLLKAIPNHHNPPAQKAIMPGKAIPATKQKKAAGTCRCCHGHFEDMAHHLKTFPDHKK